MYTDSIDHDSFLINHHERMEFDYYIHLRPNKKNIAFWGAFEEDMSANYIYDFLKH